MTLPSRKTLIAQDRRQRNHEHENEQRHEQPAEYRRSGQGQYQPVQNQQHRVVNQRRHGAQCADEPQGQARPDERQAVP
jgi:hypothetical protein